MCFPDLHTNLHTIRRPNEDLICKLDRFIKQAIVDRNAVVSSSAIVSGLHFAQDPAKVDVVRRWVSEVQESVNSKDSMVQFHALALLKTIKTLVVL